MDRRCQDLAVCQSHSRRRFLAGAGALAGSLAGGLGVAPFESAPALGGAAGPLGFESDAIGEERFQFSAPMTPAPKALSLDPVVVAAPSIITRAQWGADESLRTDTRVFAPLHKFVVHHTAGPNNPADPAAEVRVAYRFHTEGRDYADIGYQFLIDHLGNIYEGRWARDYLPGEVHSGEDVNGNLVVGAHVKDFNAGCCGIALMGTFSGVAPAPAAIDSLVELIAWKAGPRGIDVRAAEPYVRFDGVTLTFPNVVGHRD